MLLIENREMPKVCANCPCFFKREGDGEYTFLSNGCKILKMTFNTYVYYGKQLLNPYEEKYERCPLKEVVTCKNCKHWQPDYSKTLTGRCEIMNMYFTPEFYCSYGERD